MYRILLKTIAVSIAALLATLAISFTFVPMLGGQVAGAGLVMTVVCPIAISIPASLAHFYQAEKLRRANAALAQSNAKLAEAYQMLQQQSRLDTLTGILNRSAFMAELQSRSAEGGTGGLLFIDLDHFKRINDSHGHAAGDEALRRMGRLLADHAGENDVIGRLGGEEFGFFLHGASASDMLARSQQLREAVQRLEVRTAEGMEIAMGVSIGAFHCVAGFTPSSALAIADSNLYRAKSTGRNTVVA